MKESFSILGIGASLKMSKIFIPALVWLFYASSVACADGLFKLPSIISEGMVLQQGVAIPIWGWAKPSQEITVKIAGQSQKTQADQDGKWMLRLDPLQAGGPFEMVIESCEESVRFSDVLVGEVWICGGQSNMQWALKDSNNGQAEAEAANFPQIRRFATDYANAKKPNEDCKGRWIECNPQTAGDFTAVGYYFAIELQKELNVPVGLIQNAIGGTGVEEWTSREAMMTDDALKTFFSDFEKQSAVLMEQYNQKLQAYNQELELWELAKVNGDESSQPPQKPNMPTLHKPAGLFNGMIAPIIPYAIAGVIWYQSEQNLGDDLRYSKAFPALITDWRQRWGQNDFPFLFVQLPNCSTYMSVKGKLHWAMMRQAQEAALSLPKTAMVVTIDVGDPRDIHPRNKRPVGSRLARAARAVAYDMDVAFMGPKYKSIRIDGVKVFVEFENTDGGLVVKGDTLTGFALAGEDREFHPAQAEICNGMIVVWSEDVPQPLAVRYAFTDSPECNLYNGEDLPAHPFRTDDWQKPGR